MVSVVGTHASSHAAECITWLTRQASRITNQTSRITHPSSPPHTPSWSPATSSLESPANLTHAAGGGNRGNMSRDDASKQKLGDVGTGEGGGGQRRQPPTSGRGGGINFSPIVSRVAFTSHTNCFTRCCHMSPLRDATKAGRRWAASGCTCSGRNVVVTRYELLRETPCYSKRFVTR